MSSSSPSATDQHLARVDFTRGIAAVLVVAMHGADVVALPKYFGVDPVAGAFSFGARGVDFFFVLSGFIMAYVHGKDLGRPEILSSYAIKRFIRIFLPLWVVAIPFLFACLLLNAPSMPTDAVARGETVFGSLTLLPTPATPLPIVAWTLKHEVLFYAAFGVLLWRPTWGIALMSLGGLLCILHATIGFSPHFLTDFFCSVYNLEFLLGIGCGIYVRRFSVPYPRAVCVGGLLLFGFAALGYQASDNPQPWITNHSTLAQVIQFGTSSALIILGLSQLDRLKPIRLPARAALLGAASYSIYLIHVPVMSLGCKLLSTTRPFGFPAWLAMFALIGAGILAGVAMHRLIELPLLQFARGVAFSPRVPRAIAAPSQASAQ